MKKLILAGLTLAVSHLAAAAGTSPDTIAVRVCENGTELYDLWEGANIDGWSYSSDELTADEWLKKALDKVNSHNPFLAQKLTDLLKIAKSTGSYRYLPDDAVINVRKDSRIMAIKHECPLAGVSSYLPAQQSTFIDKYILESLSPRDAAAFWLSRALFYGSNKYRKTCGKNKDNCEAHVTRRALVACLFSEDCLADTSYPEIQPPSDMPKKGVYVCESANFKFLIWETNRTAKKSHPQAYILKMGNLSKGMYFDADINFGYYEPKHSPYEAVKRIANRGSWRTYDLTMPAWLDSVYNNEPGGTMLSDYLVEGLRMRITASANKKQIYASLLNDDIVPSKESEKLACKKYN